MNKEAHFTHATDLIYFLNSSSDLSIGGAVYPETHPEAESPESDIKFAFLKQKKGANYLISQLFFDNIDFFNFLSRAHKIGITVPIIPGIMPITGYSQILKFTSMCGVKIPKNLKDRMEFYREDKDSILKAGIEYTTDQCKELLNAGVIGIHFYTLNKSRATFQILQNLRKHI